MYLKFIDFFKHFGYPFVLISCGSIAVLESMRITKEYRIPKWISGPSGYVMIIGISLIIFGIAEFFIAHKTKLKKDKDAVVSFETDSFDEEVEVFNARNLWSAVLLLFAYIILIPYIGFTISSVLFIILILLLLKNSIVVTILTAILILLLLLFGLPALGLVLPRGLLGI